jgi:homopolymeric O-antigen transport system permease protein
MAETTGTRAGSGTEHATRSPAPRTIRLQPTSGFSRVLSPRELWRYRELGVRIAIRDITVRYRQTVLGAAWAVLQPLASMVVFTLVFGRLAHLPSEGSSYALFTLAGLVPWTFFANGLLLGADSMVASAGLVSKVYFPRIFIIVGVLVAGLVDLAIATVVLICAAAVSGTPPTARVFALPVFVLAAVAAALGLAAALAAANVRFRDVRYLLPFSIQIWLFLTPVAYSITLVHEPWRTIAAVNPMVGVVEGFRWAVLGSSSMPWTSFVISAATAAVLLGGGLAYFDRVERRLADLL